MGEPSLPMEVAYYCERLKNGQPFCSVLPDASAGSRYKKIVMSPESIDTLCGDSFLEAHPEESRQIILDVDATDDPLHGNQEGKSLVRILDQIERNTPTPPIQKGKCPQTPMENNPKIEITLSGSALSDLMQSVLRRGASFRFQAKGCSMSPFIRGKDIITISQIEKESIRPGNVVAVVNPVNNAVIVHRVVAKTENGILLKGDNLNAPDGIYTCDAIIGIVTNVERNGKRVGLTSAPAQKIIAFASRSGLLNSFILPFLRKVKNVGRVLV